MFEIIGLLLLSISSAKPESILNERSQQVNVKFSLIVNFYTVMLN